MASHAPAAMQTLASAMIPSVGNILRSPCVGVALHRATTVSARQPSAAAPTTSGVLSTGRHDALRFFQPTFRSTPFSSLAGRQYSTVSCMRLPELRSIARTGSVGLSLHQRRSLFGAPSQATLARLERSANSNPQSTNAQVPFYKTLISANMPQIVVQRYESGQYATNSVIDDFYNQALSMVGQANIGAPLGNRQSAQGGLTMEQLNAVGQAMAAKGVGATMHARKGAGEKRDPLFVVVEESKSTILFKWVRWIVGVAIVGFIALQILTLGVEATGAMKKIGGTTTQEVQPEHQNARFSDVHGCDESKEELQDVIDFLKNPDKYNKLGGRMPKGVLLTGPPGTGKTLLARAVAGEAGVPFFYMSGSEFDEVYVGVGAKRVRELFQTARAKAPAIVFIDELDAIGGKRKGRDANYHRQTLNQLLNDLDGFDQTTGVIFIAATNHPEILDKALLRPGRFDRHIAVDLPDVKGRMAILQHHTKRIRLAADVDLIKIARGTPGFSGAELENLANTAAIRASKYQAKAVSLLDMEWAKDKIMMGNERKSRAVPMEDKLQTAYHEGGHTLVGLYTKGYKEVHKATILPRGNAAGITFFLPSDTHHRSRAQYYVDLQVSMGGKMAEEIVYGSDNIGDGASGDISQATSVAYMMVTRFGFSDLLGNVDFSSNYDYVSPETKRLIDNEVRRLIDEARNNAKQLLISKRKELDLLAKALVQYETLDKEEILKVIKGEKLPDRLAASPEAEIKLPNIPLPPHIPIPPPIGNGNGGGPGSGSSAGAPAAEKNDRN